MRKRKQVSHVVFGHLPVGGSYTEDTLRDVLEIRYDCSRTEVVDKALWGKLMFTALPIIQTIEDQLAEP